jgi:hypothetical protein
VGIVQYIRNSPIFIITFQLESVKLREVYGSHGGDYEEYSGPSNCEQFDVRTTWNSNKKFEENPVLKLEQNLEILTKTHVVFTPCRQVAPQYRSCEQEYQSV